MDNSRQSPLVDSKGSLRDSLARPSFGSTACRQVAIGSVVHVPDVQESGIGRGRNFEPSFSSGSIERGAYFFFRRGQFGQGYFDRRAVIQLREVLEKRSDNQFMLSIATLRHVRLDHRFEVHLCFLARTCWHIILSTLLLILSQTRSYRNKS
jgi:hypothetical protein